MSGTTSRVAGLAGATALITALTVVARLAGFGRTFVVARTVGDGALANIYNAANTIPNIVFELVAGGALGNLVDRAVRSGPAGADAGFMGGAVVDFIDLQWWPIFNIADSAITVGGILGAFLALRGIEFDGSRAGGRVASAADGDR